MIGPAVALMATLLTPAAWASDPVVEALQLELGRNMADLSLSGSPPPYYIGYDLVDGWSLRVKAVLGGITSHESEPERMLGTAVRVGSPDLDNGNFEGFWKVGGMIRRGLVLGDLPGAIQHEAWLITDEAYKSALEGLASKEATLRGQAADDDRPPDFTLGYGIQASEPSLPAPDGAALEQIARHLSALFLDHPSVERSEVHLSSIGGRRVFLDSEGSLVERGHGETDLRVVATVRASDGQLMTDHVSWIVRTPADLPPYAELEEEVNELAYRLQRWRSLPVMEEEYVGPVIFSGAAAGDLFRCLLVPYLSGTPPLGREKPRYGKRKEGLVPLGLKRRVLPPGFTVVDDPLADPSLPSSYRWDDEGVPAEPVVLVEDGVIRGLLGSRTPSEDLPRSNGHARGFPGEQLRALPSWTQVQTDRPRSWRQIISQARRLAQDYDLDHVLVVKQLMDPSIQDDRRFVRSHGVNKVPEVPDPVELIRVYADGFEERLRGGSFVGLDRKSLRDVAAAGESQTGTYLIHPANRPYGSNETHGVPATITAPMVLIGEVEVQPKEGGGEKAPLVTSPLVR